MQAGGQRFDPVILHQNLKISVDVYLWLLVAIPNAALFNKTEEGCVTRADEAWVMRCDCIDLRMEYEGRTNMSLPVATLAREYKVIGSSD